MAYGLWLTAYGLRAVSSLLYFDYMTLSRRQWLWLGIPLVASGARLLGAEQGLGQFMVDSGPPCADDAKATPSVPADRTYKAGAPLKASLAEPGMPGTPLTLSGTIAGLTCGRIKGAKVEIWQADAKGVYDMAGFRLRGHVMTDADGKYRVETIVPGNAADRARHIGIHVSVPGKTEFWTEAFFADDPKNATDRRFKKELAMKMVQAPKGRQAGIFDVVLKL